MSMERANDQVGNVGLLGCVLYGFAMFKVTTRRDKCRRVVGHVGHKFPVAKGM
jgi:hypothetical protein